MSDNIEVKTAFEVHLLEYSDRLRQKMYMDYPISSEISDKFVQIILCIALPFCQKRNVYNLKKFWKTFALV